MTQKSVHYYDEEIMSGRMPAAPDADEMPNPPGHSYYWDARAEGLDHAAAVRRAARLIGSTYVSLRAVLARIGG